MKTNHFIKIFLIYFALTISAQMMLGQDLGYPTSIVLLHQLYGETEARNMNEELPFYIEHWLEKQLDTHGSIKFDQKIKDYLFSAIKGCIAKSWELIIKSSLMDKYKSTFADRLDIKYTIKFGLGYVVEEMATCLEGNYIECNREIYLIKFLNDIGQQILAGKTPVVTPDRYPQFVYSIMHELLHFFGYLGSSQKDECEVSCLVKKIFGGNYDPRKYTYGGKKAIPLECGNVKDFDAQTKKDMGEGQCFCGVDWKNKSKPVEEGCTPDGGGGGGGGGSEGGGGGGGQGEDWSDDNYSYANAGNSVLSSGGFNAIFGLSGLLGDISGEFNCSYFPDILIYNKSEPEAMKKLLIVS